MLNKIIRFFLENKLVTFLILIVFIGWGIVNSPFNWDTGILPSDPVPVDAIPDIGENQQIVYTEWAGRSPQDIEDQISYPLTTALLGIPGVKTIRSNSIFGLSSIYIIFDENVDFYWSRTRILEKLNSLPGRNVTGRCNTCTGTGCHSPGTGLLVHAGRPRQKRKPCRWLGPTGIKDHSGFLCALCADLRQRRF